VRLRLTGLGKRALALAAAIVLLGAAAALAATFSGDGTIVGTSGNDKLTAFNANNDMVFGLAGSDQIQAGNGNYDSVDGDGSCPGVKPGVYPTGLPSTLACVHVQLPFDGGTANDPNGDSISVGNGHNDTAYAGGGLNAISVGTGDDDTIYGGPIDDAINAGYGGAGNDQVYLYRGSSPYYGGSAVATGTGSTVVHSQNVNGVPNAIYCPPGNSVTVWANASDAVSSNCAHAFRSPQYVDPNPGPNPRPAADGRRAWHRAHHPNYRRALTREKKELSRLVKRRLHF
jgi:hypothetical protein